MLENWKQNWISMHASKASNKSSLNLLIITLTRCLKSTHTTDLKGNTSHHLAKAWYNCLLQKSDDITSICKPISGGDFW